MDPLLIIPAVLILSVSLTLFFVGSLVSLLTALGNRHWYWSAVTLCFLPASIVYCWTQGHIAAWPRKLVTGGAALLLAGIVVLLLRQLKPN